MTANQGNVVRVTGRPGWLPEGLVSGPVEVGLRISRAEREVFRKRKLVPVSAWAERHRYVTRGPYEGTKYRNDTVPYAGDIMDASFFPGVEEIVICAADQVAKSFIIDTCIGYCVDRLPGPVLYVYPDEKTAKENSSDRIQPLFDYSPRLKSYVTGNPDDMGQQRINLAHMQIYMSWARSAISLANKSIKYLVTDEEDKYPATAGSKEGSPVDKARKRLRTFTFGRKHWRCSTPTIPSGPIWQAINECQVVFEFWVACPDCGQAQVMTFPQIKFGEEREPVRVRNIPELTFYECLHCQSRWGDAKRNMAVKMGQWRAMTQTPDGSRQIEGGGLELGKYLEKHRPRTIGFHVPAWLSRFVALAECAAAFLEGLKNKNKLKDFNNSYRAFPWQDITAERAEDSILALKDDRPRGVAPSGDQVSCLIGTVDTQDNGFWYEVRAWGWGESLTSWGVREGFVTTFEDVLAIMTREQYLDVDGHEHYVRLVLQDAMGHRTAEVYDFIRQRQGRFIATRGEDRRKMTMPLSWSNQEFYPGGKKPIAGGIKLLRIDVNYFKNELSRRLAISPDDPGAWRLHSQTTEEYARQMCSEGLNEQGVWEQIGARPNHFWDCGVLQLAAVDLLRVKYWKKPREQKKEKRPVFEPETETRKGWLPKAKGWLGGERGTRA